MVVVELHQDVVYLASNVRSHEKEVAESIYFMTDMFLPKMDSQPIPMDSLYGLTTKHKIITMILLPSGSGTNSGVTLSSPWKGPWREFQYFSLLGISLWAWSEDQIQIVERGIVKDLGLPTCSHPYACVVLAR